MCALRMPYELYARLMCGLKVSCRDLCVLYGCHVDCMLDYSVLYHTYMHLTLDFCVLFMNWKLGLICFFSS